MKPLQADFFARLGLYTARDFLTPELCASVTGEMRAAAATPATVAEEGNEAIDESYRRTKQAQVSDETAAAVAEAFSAAVPELAAHFERELRGAQKPQFLVYREGDFFRRHEDNSDDPDAPEYVRQRSVSAVVFLNGATPDDPAGYSGGSLVFYGLMDDSPQGDTVGLALAPEPGLLVAFPSELVHAVTEVTAGERFTLVNWFY
jgi:SM-20-related protein